MSKVQKNKPTKPKTISGKQSVSGPTPRRFVSQDHIKLNSNELAEWPHHFTLLNNFDGLLVSFRDINKVQCLAHRRKRRQFRTLLVRETTSRNSVLRNHVHTRPTSRVMNSATVTSQGMPRSCQDQVNTRRTVVKRVKDRLGPAAVPSTEASAKLSLKKPR